MSSAYLSGREDGSLGEWRDWRWPTTAWGSNVRELKLNLFLFFSVLLFVPLLSMA